MNACKIVLYMAKALLSQEVILKKKTTKNKKEKKTKTKKQPTKNNLFWKINAYRFA